MNVEELTRQIKAQVGYFYSNNESDRLLCIYGQGDRYKAGEKYSLHQFEALQRALAHKFNLLSEDVTHKDFAEEGCNEVCFIQAWSPFKKEVIFIHLKDFQEDEIESLQELIKNKDLLAGDFYSKLRGRA